MEGQLGDVEIQVLRVANTVEEEAQVAAALDGEAALVRPRAEEPNEVEVKELDGYRLLLGKKLRPAPALRDRRALALVATRRAQPS